MPIFDVLVCFIQEQIATMKVKKNPGKPGISGSGSWTRTSDIRINSKFLISGLFLQCVVLTQISATFCTYLCMRRIAVF